MAGIVRSIVKQLAVRKAHSIDQKASDEEQKYGSRDARRCGLRKGVDRQLAYHGETPLVGVLLVRPRIRGFKGRASFRLRSRDGFPRGKTVGIREAADAPRAGSQSEAEAAWRLNVLGVG